MVAVRRGRGDVQREPVDVETMPPVQRGERVAVAARNARHELVVRREFGSGHASARSDADISYSVWGGKSSRESQFARPTRYLSPVGAGTPPSGSSVTAIATGVGISGGVAIVAFTRPFASSVSMPALIGADSFVSTQS